MPPTLAPVKGAQVPKVDRCQRRLSQKPQFVFFFIEAFPKQDSTQYYFFFCNYEILLKIYTGI